MFQDVDRLLQNLPKATTKSYKIPMEKFNHVDFMWAKDAPKLVYEPLLKEIKDN